MMRIGLLSKTLHLFYKSYLNQSNLIILVYSSSRYSESLNHNIELITILIETLDWTDTKLEEICNKLIKGRITETGINNEQVCLMIKINLMSILQR